MSASSFPGAPGACERLRMALETTGMGVWSWDSGAAEIVFDSACCRIHGLQETDARRLLWEEFLALVHPDDRRHLEVIRQGGAQDFHDVEYRRLLPEGDVRWVSCSGRPLAGATPREVVGSITDISERKLVQQQLVHAQKLEAVGQLTAGISHNFNNILSAIVPSLQLAAEHVRPQGAKLIRNARLAAERATDLVSELMVVAGRKEAAANEPLELIDVVERVVRICRTTFGDWVQLVFEDEGDYPIVRGNESQIEQVLLNLLLNARDAFEEANVSCPRIDIELLWADAVPGRAPQAILRVTDNGPGMAEATRNRVFDPFFTTKGTGTGLGLATVYAIVSDHGGTISCESYPDDGTRFEVRLPASEAALEEDKPPPSSPVVGGSETILVVDDDSLVRKVTMAALAAAGYTVVEAADGTEALCAQQRGTAFDLVLLDMAMPELSGEDVLGALRGRDPSLRVLIFTGLSDPRVVRPGDVDVLQKPADASKLLRAVRHAIDARRIN